jgi:hypothetical protein
MAVTPHATKQDYEAALSGAHFPISKSALVSLGRDKGGVDREVNLILQRIADRAYHTLDDVKEQVRAVYRGMGVGDSDLPI